MSDQSNKDIEKSASVNDELDIVVLYKILWRTKYFIFILSMIFAIGSVFFALTLPNIFRAETVIVSSFEKKDSGGISQLSGIASMAGISIGGVSGGGADKSVMALEVLKSRTFIIKFISERNIKPYLIAIKEWDENGTPIWDEEIYDTSTGKLKDIANTISEEVLHRNFLSKISISQDNKTKIIKIGLEFNSAKLASEWLNFLICDLNEFMRQKDQEESQRSLKFLEDKISSTSLADIKSVLFQLVEDNTKTLMLVNIRQEYVFKTIDPAIAPSERFKPNRRKIVMFGTFLGFGVGYLLSIIWYLKNKKKFL